MQWEFITIKGKAEKITSLIFLLHGYGANAENLSNIGEYWVQNMLPETCVICPNAPFPFEVDDGSYGFEGRQWFSLFDRSYHAMVHNIGKVQSVLTDFIVKQMEIFNISNDRLILSGFSQGCMLSLYLGLYTNLNPRGILGYSGMLLRPKEFNIHEYLAKYDATGRERPEIMLVHGSVDEVVPLEAFQRSEEMLRKQKENLTTFVEEGLAHGISAPGVLKGGEFICKLLA